VDWSDAWSAVDTTELSDGLISGWYNGFNDDYSAITPTLPLTAIPGPATVAVLVLLGGRRRR
jgi:MYXO-CTERM domain-containing protein